MAMIFVSYAREEKALMEAFILSALGAERADYWCDANLSETCSDDKWWNEIAKQIEDAPCFTFLFTESWVRSEICQREYVTAKALNKEIVPVQIDHFSIPASHVHIPGEIQICETFSNGGRTELRARYRALVGRVVGSKKKSEGSSQTTPPELYAYCETVAEQNRKLRILGRGTPMDLADIFLRIPLAPRESPRTENIVVDDLLTDKVGNRVLLVGGPGSGKSTILQFLQVESAGNKCLFFPLRTTFRHLVSITVPLFEWLSETLKGHIGIEVDEFTRSTNTVGPRLLVLLDGLDEIGDSDSQRLSQDLLKFSIRYPGVRFIVSSRPEGFAAAQYADFDKFDLQPLRERDIRLYVEAVVPKESTERVWNTITAHPRIFELAATPFLLALICAAHDEIGPRARQRASIFKASIRYLLRVEDYDVLRQRIGRDEESSLFRVLKSIAVRFFKLDYVDNFSRIEVIHNISLIPGHQTEADKILSTIVERTGLLQFDRDGYHFVHRSIWEYLVAEGCRDGERSVLLDRANLRQWEEPIRLFVGLSPESEVPNILEQLWDRNPTLALRAMTEVEKFPEETLKQLYRSSDDDEKVKIIQELRKAMKGSSSSREKDRLLVDTAGALVYAERDCENLFHLHTLLENSTSSEAADIRARILNDAGLSARLIRYGGSENLKFEFVEVPSGEFVMGIDTQSGDKPADASEKPSHRVYVDRFWISKYLVTNALYYADFPYAVDRRNEYSQKSSQPVNHINWFEAMIFAKWLGCDLPTDAEWEYAARSGGKDDIMFADSALMNDLAWHGENSQNSTHNVGTKLANSWGLFDVAGNLREWCKDWFGESYYRQCKENGLTSNPQGPVTGDKKVLRGGTFDWALTNLRPTYRNFNTPNNRNHVTGFRLVIRNESTAQLLGLWRSE